MCDTLYKKTPNGFIFGKNSDRSPNEPNLTIFYPAKEKSNDDLQCTYLKVDSAKKTHALILIQPSWIWGGEMGINDQGVVIGNEAVFTKSKGKKTNKLIGMDFLRLALERGSSAKESMNIIISLLEKYGQGGNCGFDKYFYYDNSFLICDKNEAFVLETCANEWVCIKIGDHYNISNRLSVNDNYYASTTNLKNFASKNSDLFFTYFSKSKVRQESGQKFLEENQFNLRKMIAALSNHHQDDENKLYEKGSVRSLCMHKSALGDHTTASMIVQRHDNFSTIWLNGCSTPCLSIYKPTYFSNLIPPVYSDKELSYNYWLKRENLVRLIYAKLINVDEYIMKKDRLQEQFITEEEEILKNNPNEQILREFSLRCHQREEDFINSYLSEIEQFKCKINQFPKLWQKYSKNLGKNVFETDVKTRLK